MTATITTLKVRVKMGKISNEKPRAKVWVLGNSYWVISPNGDKVKCHNRETASFIASKIDNGQITVK